jgi:hypothetical protein
MMRKGLENHLYHTPYLAHRSQMDTNIVAVWSGRYESLQNRRQPGMLALACPSMYLDMVKTDIRQKQMF